MLRYREISRFWNVCIPNIVGYYKTSNFSFAVKIIKQTTLKLQCNSTKKLNSYLGKTLIHSPGKKSLSDLMRFILTGFSFITIVLSVKVNKRKKRDHWRYCHKFDALFIQLTVSSYTYPLKFILRAELLYVCAYL